MVSSSGAECVVTDYLSVGRAGCQLASGGGIFYTAASPLFCHGIFRSKVELHHVRTRHFIAAETATPPFFVGIDLGGTNIKFGVVDDLGRPLSWLSIPTEVQRGPEDAARRMGAAVREVIAKAGLQPQAVARVGFGSAGPMDLPAGIITSPVNLAGWDNFPIRDRVSDHCGLPVTFENDANAAAYGEFWVGAGRGLASLVLLTLGHRHRGGHHPRRRGPPRRA